MEGESSRLRLVESKWIIHSTYHKTVKKSRRFVLSKRNNHDGVSPPKSCAGVAAGFYARSPSRLHILKSERETRKVTNGTNAGAVDDTKFQCHMRLPAIHQDTVPKLHQSIPRNTKGDSNPILRLSAPASPTSQTSCYTASHCSAPYR